MSVVRIGASWVVPVDGPPIRDGRVAVRDGRIVWLGQTLDPGEPEGPLVDLGNGVLLPGLVNAHTHLELSGLAGLTRSDRGFVPWVESLVTARPSVSPERMRRATEAALAKLTRIGTAAIGDVSNTLGHLDLLATTPLDSVVFHELIGWHPSSAREILEDARRQRGVTGSAVIVRQAAHTPQSVCPELLRAMLREGGVHSIHVAESLAEVEFVRSGGGPWAAFLGRRGLAVSFDGSGVSPVRHLDALGVLRPGLVAVHCVHVDTADIRLLASRGTRVVLCPRSNQTLGVGEAPVQAMLDAGLLPGLGTDSLASSPSLDVLEEAVFLHRSWPAIPPASLVRMATRGGAAALGIGDLGRIASGNRGPLAFAPSSADLRDPEGFLVSGEAQTGRVELSDQRP